MDNIVALDMSPTSSGICILENGIYNLYFFPQRKREINFYHSVKNFRFKALNPIDKKWSHERRWEETTQQIMDLILKVKDPVVVIEGYVYGSISRGVSMIFEVGGIMRNKLYNNGIEYSEFGPGTIKKFATGSGNANKFIMYHNFVNSTGVDPNEILGLTIGKDGTIKKATEDIIDSYYLCLLKSGQEYKIPEKSMIDGIMSLF